MSHHTPKEWLQKWLEGDLTRQEEQQLYAAAQQDPFLADALEGLTVQPEMEHRPQLIRIEQRLAQRVADHQAASSKATSAEAKVVRMPPKNAGWQRIAAAAVLLLVALGGMWFVGGSGDDTSTASEANKIDTSPSVVPIPESGAGSIAEGASPSELPASDIAPEPYASTGERIEVPKESSEATPIIGFTRFEDYLRTQMSQTEQHGKLVWLFKLDENGQPIEVQLVEGGDSKWAGVAVEWLERGGKWQHKTDDADQLYRYEWSY